MHAIIPSNIIYIFSFNSRIERTNVAISSKVLCRSALISDTQPYVGLYNHTLHSWWLWNWLGDYMYFFPLSSSTLFLHTCIIIPLCSAISPYKLEWSCGNNHRILIQVWKFFPRRQQLDSQNKSFWSPKSCQIGIGFENNLLDLFHNHHKMLSQSSPLLI